MEGTTHICRFICIKALVSLPLLPSFSLSLSSRVLSACVSAGCNISLVSGYEWLLAPLLCAVSHLITIIYKTHSGSVDDTHTDTHTCPPGPALSPQRYSKYLHAILSCWEFPWWREPPLHEIFRAREASRVFTPIWWYAMILSWAMTVLLNYSQPGHQVIVTESTLSLNPTQGGRLSQPLSISLSPSLFNPIYLSLPLYFSLCLSSSFSHFPFLSLSSSQLLNIVWQLQRKKPYCRNTTALKSTTSVRFHDSESI